MTCHIRLLGPIEFKKEGVALHDFGSRKALALLAYLSRQDKPVSRNHLADLFWPDKAKSRGRRNLTRELSWLSTQLNDCFETNYHTIQFKPTSACWIDVIAFETLIAGSGLGSVTLPTTRNPSNPIVALEPYSSRSNLQEADLIEAINLYRGQFMAEFYLDGCPDFEAWLAVEQEMWRQHATKILDRLITHLSSIGAYTQAQSFATRWLLLEPWQEKAHQWQMQLLALSGQRNAALLQFETCRRILADELDVEPTIETVTLYSKIKNWAGTGDAGRLLEPEFLAIGGTRPPLLDAAAPDRNKLPDTRPTTLTSNSRAERSTKRNLRIYPLAAASIFVVLLILMIAGIAINQFKFIRHQVVDIVQTEAIVTNRAAIPFEQAASQSLSAELATQAIFYMNKLPDLSLLLSLEASRRANLPQEKTDLFVNLEYSPFLDTFLHNNTGPVLDLAFSPDGQLLASVNGDNMITLWDVATRQPLTPSLTGHTAEIISMAFSPNGQILASVGANGTIQLWDTLALQPLGPPLSHHPDHVSSVAFSPTGKILVSGTTKGSIILWQVETRELLSHPLVAHTGPVTHLVFNPDGQTLTSAGQDNKIILWDMENLGVIGSPLTAHTSEVTNLVFSSDSQILALSGRDNTILLWDVPTQMPLKSPSITSNEQVTSLAFSPNGQILAFGGSSTTITVWDLAAGALMGVPLEGHTGQISAIKFSPDGKTLASGSIDGSLIIWNLAAARYLSAYKADVRWVVFSPDGHILASAGTDNHIILWDVATGRPLREPLVGHNDSLLRLAFSPDSQTLASSSADGTIILWDVATGLPIRPPLTAHKDWVMDVAFSPDGKILASSSADNSIILWDTATYQPLTSPLDGHTDWVWRVAFSPDGKILASGGQDSQIILWDVATAQPLDSSPLADHHSWVTSLAFSSDGRMLASGSADQTIILWDIATHKPLGRPFTGHTGWVWDTIFSPIGNNQSLVSCSDDSKIILWDVITGQPLGPPLLGNTKLESVDLSPDGSILAVGGGENQVTLWNISYEPWSNRACHIANRNLTQTEWNKFIGPDIPYELTCPNLPPG